MYCIVQGFVEYKNQDALNQAIGSFEEYKFMKDGFFVDELGTPISEKPCVDGLRINIPYSLYDSNILGVDLLPQVLKNMSECYIVWSSTEGNGAGILSSEHSRVFDLKEWGNQNNIPVLITGDNEQSEDDIETAWLESVEEAFHEKFENPIYEVQ